MKLKIFFIILIVFFFFTNCQKKTQQSLISSQKGVIKKVQKLTKKELKNWHHKDIELDTIPGISLKRAYNSLLTNKKGNEVIIALIDTEIDINHEKLKNSVWINSKEVINNGIDDDNNGYIDDINGWNFLGNPNRQNNKFVNFEYTRILKNFTSKFKNKTTVQSKDSVSYLLYKKVKNKYDKRLKSDLAEKENYNTLYNLYFNAKKELSAFFINKPYTIKALDSLKNTKANTIADIHFLVLTDCIKNNIDDEYVKEKKYLADERVNKLLNLNYNDRLIQGDNPDDLSDTQYGNNIVNLNAAFLNHGTKMAGIISNISSNNEFKIMPLAISAYGDEHDKDIALAIRYAVDNGAKIINMSFGKEFSLHKEWVFKAIQYAEQHGVLIISSAGNFNYDLNLYNDYYPNDNINNEVEISDNFLLIGAVTYTVNKNFKTRSSNFGADDVDLFAPGEKIFTTLPNNKYSNNVGGTSSASAITSGVAALLYSYYPNLTASQVKHVLMDSGLEYTIEVNTPTKEDKNKTTPLNQLSKSGKVLNAYNALIMADSISRN